MSSPVVTPKKRPAAEAFVPRVNEVIAYVHEVSPTRHNKTNTLEYFDIRLQTETSPSQRAVCFSKNKRQLFVDRQKTKTPIKLTNYSMSENKSDILINNMTRVTQAEAGEYSFQIEYQSDVNEESYISVKDIEKIKPFGVVNVKAKVTKKNYTKFVSNNKLKAAEAALSDGSASIKLHIWEDQIPLVELLPAYSFVGVRVREWNNNLSLSTSHDTKIEELPESESGTLSSVNVDTEPDVITMSATVSSVVAI